MSYQIDLTPLLKEQFKLDKAIQDNHHVSYKETRQDRVMALLVELGEFANTTRSFKFWSNKGFDKKEVMLDEAADCLHFYLSLCLSSIRESGSDKYLEERVNQEKIILVDMDEPYESTKSGLTNNLYNAISRASSNGDIHTDFLDLTNPNGSFTYFLKAIAGLGFRWDDLEKAYYKKLGVNYDRQNNNY